MLHAIVHPADIQDRDGGILLLATLFGMYPFLKKLFADGGYQGPEFQKALAKILPHLETEIVKRSDQAKGFVVLPRRWVVERTNWLGSTAAEGSPRIGKISTARRSRSCASHQSASCSESFAIPLDVPGRNSRSEGIEGVRSGVLLADPYVPGSGSNDNAQKQGPASDTDYEAQIARLAALSLRGYELQRGAAAKQLGLRVTFLDEEVATARTKASAKGADAPHSDQFKDDPEPWPESISGCELLDRLTKTIINHLVLPRGAAESVALWILHAHTHDCFDVSPILAVTSPTPECGKTTCLTLLGALVPRPCSASNVTPAALFRAIDKWSPTLLIDEADTFLKNSDELRGVLNSGHHRATAYIIRTTGDDHEPRRFRTWAPKAVALIGNLPATLASRSIHIELRRKAASEKVERLRLDRLDHLEVLHRQAARWAKDNAGSLRSAEPQLPEALTGRAADNWRPLLSIADLVGGDWPAHARLIAQARDGRAGQTAGIMLLEDIQRILVNRRIDRIPSADLAEALSAMENRPWPEWRQDKPITPRQIAKLLEPFGVTPGTIRIAGGTTVKGYKLEQFTEVFQRYVSAESVTPSQAHDSAGLRTDASVTPTPDVTDETPHKDNDCASCDGVTDDQATRLNRKQDIEEGAWTVESSCSALVMPGFGSRRPTTSS